MIGLWLRLRLQLPRICPLTIIITGNRHFVYRVVKVSLHLSRKYKIVGPVLVEFVRVEFVVAVGRSDCARNRARSSAYNAASASN